MSYYENSMEPKYFLPVSRISASLSPQTANQISQFGTLLNQGVKNVEIQGVSPEVMEAIPKEHFKEINRLAKVTGSETSLHGPIIDMAGLTQQGYSEGQRIQAEKQVESVLDRAYMMNESGNTFVNFHSSTLPLQEFRKEGLKEGQLYQMGVINQDDGKITALPYEEKKFFGKEEVVYTPQKRLEILNHSQWDDEKLKLHNYNHEVSRLMGEEAQIENQLGVLEQRRLSGLQYDERTYNALLGSLKAKRAHIDELSLHMDLQFREMGNKLLKYGGRDEINAYTNIAQKDLEDYNRKLMERERIREKIIKNGSASMDDITKLRNIDAERSQLIIGAAHKMPAPDLWVPVEQFAAGKTADTVANAMVNSYKKHKNNTPTLLLENVYPEMPFSRAESMNDLIKKSREKFAEKLVSEKLASKSDANKVAEKLIGATWDTGHINLLKRYGYTDKDIIEETKKVAKNIKHVHMADNFGFQDAHLPPGMGDVPNKEMLKELEKAGWKNKAVMESGGFVRFFEQSPQQYILGEMNSPIYSGGQQYWNPKLVDSYGQYFSGYGEIFPQHHLDMYGTSFINLPPELGGQVGGKSRFSGAPME